MTLELQTNNIDVRRYLTDPAYKDAVDTQSEDELRRADEYHRWLWDFSSSPGVAAQHFRIDENQKPIGFRPAVLGTWMLDRRPMVLGTNGYIYGCGMVGSGLGLYQECEGWIRRVCILTHGLDYIGDPALSLIKWMRNEMGAAPVDLTQPLPGGLVNVRNGMLDVITQQVLLHDCDYVSVVQIPVNWTPEATCPLIDSFLQEVCADEETVELVWEMVGYIVFGYNERQKAFLLRGPGGNGKSVLLWVLTNLIGRQYVQVSSLADLCDNRFRAAGLYGKKANICGDIGNRAVENVDMFKRLTGSDEIEAEHKNRDPFKFRNKAVLVFSANEEPRLLDKTKAVSDRWIPISMPCVFRGTKQEDPDLFNKLTSRGELEGALVRAAAAYMRLEARGQFIAPAATAKLKREYKAANSSAMDFYFSCLEDTGNSEDRVLRSKLHAAYKQWIWEEGDPKYTLKRRKFLSELETELGPLDDHGPRISTLQGREYVTGLRWTESGTFYAGKAFDS